jgi:hypothetical protein
VRIFLYTPVSQHYAALERLNDAPLRDGEEPTPDGIEDGQRNDR